MATVVAAVRDAANTLANKQVVDMADVIDLIEPDATPFMVLLKQGIGKRTAHNWKVQWLTDEPFPYTDTVNGSYTHGGGTLTVDNGSYWRVNDVGVELGNYQVFRVTAKSGNNLTITEVGSWDSDIADGETLLNLGSAYEAGADYVNPVSTKASVDYNYLQIQRDTVGATEIWRLTKTYGQNDWAYQLAKKMASHKRQIERSLIYSERSYVTTGTHPYGTVRGVHNWISTNANSSFGAFSWASLKDEILKVVKADMSVSPDVVILTTLDVLGYAMQGTESAIRITTGAKVYGLNINTFICPGLNKPAVLLPHPELSKLSDLSGVAYILAMNPERIKYVRAAGNGISLDTHVRVNIQDPGETIRIDEIYTAFSLEVHHEKTLAFVAGITAPS